MFRRFRRNRNIEIKKSLNRYIKLFLIVMVILLYIIVKLIFLQIVDYDYNNESAKSKSHKSVEISAPRGNIYDSKGNILAASKQTYVLVYTDTTEAQKSFFSTMENVFAILDSRNEKIDDNFPIKLNDSKNGFDFAFNAIDEEGKKTLERIFKNDIGLQDVISNKQYKKSFSSLKDDEKDLVKSKSLEMTADETFNELSKLYKIPENYSLEKKRSFVIVKNSIKLQSFSEFKPISIASNISKETAMIFSQKINSLPGISVDLSTQRYYPNGEMGAPFLGYISKISDAKYEDQGYNLSTDYKGVTGVEATFEDRLRGSKGAKIVEVNKSGKIISELAEREPYPGQNVYLTIDNNIQKVAENSLNEAMKNLRGMAGLGAGNANRGAVVAIDVNTGAILAMASLPTFDPNDFANPAGLTNEKRTKYFNSYNSLEKYAIEKGWNNQTINLNGKVSNKLETMLPKNKVSGYREDIYDYFPKPLLNYATSSIEPPGSTFKPFTAIIGLETGVINQYTTYYDQARYDLGGNNFTTFPDDGPNGVVEIKKALEVSSNPYFMDVGKQLLNKYKSKDEQAKAGIDNEFDILAKYAYKFGLGAESKEKAYTGIEINESFGQVFNYKSNLQQFYILGLDGVMSVLKKGAPILNSNGATVGNIPPIDLYYHDGSNENDKNPVDSESVRKKKDEIKAYLKSIFDTGKYSEDKVKQLFEELTQLDPIYKDVTFEKSNKNNIKGDIGWAASTIYTYIYIGGYKQAGLPYHMFNASIGQGNSNFTPLQMASAIGTLVNGGTRYKAHLLEKVTDPDGNLIYETKPEVLDKIELKKSNLDLVKQGMYQVINGSKGTAQGVFDGFQESVGGKTGSATFRNDQTELGRNAFSWFISFAPFDKPEIAVCTVIFDGHFGRYAAPVNRAVMEEYFRRYHNMP